MYFCSIINDNMKDLHKQIVGMRLCVKGRAEALVNGVFFEMSEGVLCGVSPLVQLYVMNESEDFEQIAVTGLQEEFFPAVEPLFNALLGNKLYIRPYMMLDDMRKNGFLSAANYISMKEKQLGETTDETLRKIIMQTMLHMKRALILECMQAFLEQKAVEPEKNPKGMLTVVKFIQLLAENFRTEHSCDFYASQSGLTFNHFTYTVKKVTGHTPKEWINTFLTQEARHMLSKQGMRVKEVADALNFPEQYTFSRFFKTQTGKSPKEFQTRK